MSAARHRSTFIPSSVTFPSQPAVVKVQLRLVWVGLAAVLVAGILVGLVVGLSR